MNLTVRLNGETIIPQTEIDPDLSNLRKNVRAFKTAFYEESAESE